MTDVGAPPTGFLGEIKAVFDRCTRLHNPDQAIWYHYTTVEGCAGILQSGGLRACSRAFMNDENEIRYGRDLVDSHLHRAEIAAVDNSVYRMLTSTRFTLNNLHLQNASYSGTFCACLTPLRNDEYQWKNYGADGAGVAMGFNLLNILDLLKPRVREGQPFFCPLPVLYERAKQENLIAELVECACVATANRSRQAGPLTPEEIRSYGTDFLTILINLVDILKDPKYAPERELRLLPNPANDSMRIFNPSYYTDGRGRNVPYVLLDFRNPATKRIPIAEIIIGPHANRADTTTKVHKVLRGLGYGNSAPPGPRILSA